jgi:apolipoprotein D and lipocalin family protein
MIRRLILISLVALSLGACATFERGPVGNPAVPQPAKPVDLSRYVGLWYEIARYDNGFERGCEGVTAEYGLLPDGLVSVVNTCRDRAPDGPERVARGQARVVEGSGAAKLKVSFFGPLFIGDYWVLDRADDYSWAIVGEPSGRYLWVLSRDPAPAPAVRAGIEGRVSLLGYDLDLLRSVRHSPRP